MASKRDELLAEPNPAQATACQAAVAQARALKETIRARAADADAARRIPEETIDALLDSGLFGVLKPRSFGGLEAGLETLVEVTAELASACGSTGWVYGVVAGHGWLINLFPSDAQHEVCDDPHALTATVFRFGGQVTREPGGFRLRNGTGRFCSGIDHVSWVIVGNAVVGDDAPPEPRFFVIPKSDFEIIDDWRTVGMRGTGSRALRVAETFIPEHRSVGVAALAKGESPGAELHRAPLYRMPFQLVAPFSIIGAPLGIARGAVELYLEGLKAWLDGQSELEVASKAATFARAAEASAELDAAHALVRADAKHMDSLTEPRALEALDRARLPRNWAYAAQTARDTVSRLFAAAGGGTVYDGSELQRLWRDVNAAAQHYAFGWDNAMSDYGRVAIGLPALNTIPGKRK